MTTGTLKLQLHSSSYLFQRFTPIEIRDSQLRLRKSAASGDTVELEPGLYQVSAVLEDGHAHRALAEVEEGGATQVELSLPPSLELPSYKAITIAGQTDAPQIVTCLGAVHRFQRGRWVFYPLEGGTDVTPVAIVRSGDSVFRLSLPINPQGNLEEERACILELESYMEEGPPVPRPTIHPSRRVTRALTNMITAENLGAAVTLVESAEDLLLHKYRDPVGALVGALVMHRVGTLKHRLGWLENLARDFQWLPDGRILLGIQLMRAEDPSTRSRGASLILETRVRRPLFTATYGHLLDALRRWSFERRSADARAMLDDIVVDAPYTDWSALVLTQRMEHPT